MNALRSMSDPCIHNMSYIYIYIVNYTYRIIIIENTCVSACEQDTWHLCQSRSQGKSFKWKTMYFCTPLPHLRFSRPLRRVSTVSSLSGVHRVRNLTGWWATHRAWPDCCASSRRDVKSSVLCCAVLCCPLPFLLVETIVSPAMPTAQRVCGV